MGTVAMGNRPLYFSALSHATMPMPKMKFGTTTERSQTDSDISAFEDAFDGQFDFARHNSTMIRINTALALGTQIANKRRELLVQDGQESLRMDWNKSLDRLSGKLQPFWNDLVESMVPEEAADIYFKHHRDLDLTMTDGLRKQMLRTPPSRVNRWITDYYAQYAHLKLLGDNLERIRQRTQNPQVWKSSLLELAKIYGDLSIDTNNAEHFPEEQRKLWQLVLEPLTSQAEEIWKREVTQEVPVDVLSATLNGLPAATYLETPVYVDLKKMTSRGGHLSAALIERPEFN